MHDLIDWIVTRNQPLSEVVHQVTCRVINPDGTCSKTSRKYILNLVTIVEDKIAAILLEKVALILDG